MIESVIFKSFPNISKKSSSNKVQVVKTGWTHIVKMNHFLFILHVAKASEIYVELEELKAFTKKCAGGSHFPVNDDGFFCC